MMSEQNPFEIFSKFNLYNNDMFKSLENFKLPGVNMNALLSSQEKNIDALNAANRTAVEGIQALARQQAEILRQSMDEATRVAKEIADIGELQDIPAKQAEIAKAAFEMGLANMKELADIAAKSNAEAIDLVNKRVAESFDDLKDVVTPKKD